MPSIHSLQSVMNKGELTPKLHSRTDSPYYRMGLKECRNFYPLVQGGVTKRSGTRYVGRGLMSGLSTPGVLAPFIFSEQQAYVLEFADRTLGFVYQGAPVMSAPGSSTRYTIATPYAVSDLAGLDYVQSADVVYITHPNHPVQKLQRFGETNWTLTPYTPKNGPWLDVNVKDNPATATGLSVPPISASGNFSDNRSPSNLLSKQTDIYWRHDSVPTGITYDLGASGALVCNGYELTGANPGWGAEETPRVVTTYPRKFRLLGSNNGTSWDVLDNRVAETDWQNSEERPYYFKNERAYRYYLLDIETRNGDRQITTLGCLRLSFAARPGTLAFNSVTNINNGAGFNANDIGRQIRWQGDDGYWRIFTITGVTSTTSVSGTWSGFWLWNANVSNKAWQLGAFSKNSGYPATATIFQERLCFAATRQQPRTVFMSQSGDYETFEIPDPLTDSAPLTITLAGTQQDKIEWLRETEQLLMVGTTDGIASIGGAEDAAISSTNVQQRRHTGFGTAPGVPPVRVGSVLVFAGFHRNTLHELVYSAQNNGYDAPNMAVLADHIYAKKVNDTMFSQSPHDQIFLPLDDGNLAAMTYERAQEVVGNCVLEFPGAKVLSATVVPELGRDALYLLMARTIDGQSRQELERLEKPFDYGVDDDAWFLDCALAYSGAQTIDITGLDHLEGQTVRVYGWDTSTHPIQGTTAFTSASYVVTNGAIKLAISVTKAVVGLPFTARIRTLPHFMDASDGTTLMRAKRVEAVSLSLLNSRALTLQAGGNNIERPVVEEIVPLRAFTDQMDKYPPLFTGIVETNIDDTWEGRGEIIITSEEPHPATILAITCQVDWEPGVARQNGG